MISDISILLEYITKFIKDPSWKIGIFLAILIIPLSVVVIRRFTYDQRKYKKQKKEILEKLVVNGLNDKALTHLKKIIELCQDNKPKEFHDYLTINKKDLDFFMKYPTIYKDITEDDKLFEYKELQNSKDIFGDIWLLGRNVCDIMNDNVLTHLDTALLMTDEGKIDLKEAKFYFEELIQKSKIINELLSKLEKNIEFKKHIVKNMHFRK